MFLWMQVLEGNEFSGGWCASGPLGDWADWLFSRTWKHSIGFNTIHEAISLVFCFVLRKCTETHRVVAGPLLHAWTLWQYEWRWQGLHRASPRSGSGLCPTVGWALTAYANALMHLVCLPDISEASTGKSFIDNQCQHAMFAMFALVRLIWLWLPAPLTLSTLIGRILLRPCNFVNTHN